MRNTFEKVKVQCLCGCGRVTDKPRQGMAFACYQRARRGSVLLRNAACKQCGETDRIVLRNTAAGVLCANDLARSRAVAA